MIARTVRWELPQEAKYASTQLASALIRGLSIALSSPPFQLVLVVVDRSRYHGKLAKTSGFLREFVRKPNSLGPLLTAVQINSKLHPNFPVSVHAN